MQNFSRDINGNAPIGLPYSLNYAPQLQGMPSYSAKPASGLPIENLEKTKMNTKKVTHACTLCKKDHASCDNARPCKRCLGRGIPEQCVDAESKKRGRKKIESEDKTNSPVTKSVKKESHSIPGTPTDSNRQFTQHMTQEEFTKQQLLFQQQQQQLHHQQIPVVYDNYPPNFSQPYRSFNPIYSQPIVNNSPPVQQQMPQQTMNQSQMNQHKTSNPFRTQQTVSPSIYTSPIPTTSPSNFPFPNSQVVNLPASPSINLATSSSNSSPNLQLGNVNINSPFSYSNSSSTNQSPASTPPHSGHETNSSATYIPTVSNRSDNNNILYENLMDMMSEENNERPGDFLWLMDQMMPNYFQQQPQSNNNNSQDETEDPFAFLASPALSQRGNLFSYDEMSGLELNGLLNNIVSKPKKPLSSDRYEGLTNNPSIVPPPEKESYDPKYESEQPPSLSIRSNETVFTMVRIMVAKGVLSENEIHDHFAKLRTSADKIQEIREGISQEQKLAMKKDFDGFLNSFKNGAAQIGVPGMIWDRSGVVHYVNQSFIDMTGMSMKLPSVVDDYALLQIFSSVSLKEYTKFMRDNYFKPTVVKKIMAAGIKVWGKKQSDSFPVVPQKTSITTFCEGPYIEGTMCITIKRDVLGLPMIMFGHFLPSAHSLATLKF